MDRLKYEWKHTKAEVGAWNANNNGESQKRISVRNGKLAKGKQWTNVNKI